MSELISISEALQTEKIKLRKDLMEGKINLDLYGLEFYAFLDKARKGEYFHNPKQFFDRTYITSNIQVLIEAVYRRALGDKSENPAHLLDTTFGGGKTHTLICLHHFFTNFEEAIRNEELKELVSKEGIQEDKLNMKVIGIDGHSIPTPTKKTEGVKTLWGLVGQLLGNYDVIKEFDEELKVPDVKLIEQILPKESQVLILLDELVVYLKRAKSITVGKSNLSELTLSFLHSLLVAIKNTENSSIVLTVTGKEEAYEVEALDIEKTIKQLRSIFVRQAKVHAPIQDIEIYPVIQKQLFESIDENTAKDVADGYFKFLRKYSEHLPEIVDRPELKDLIEKSYPFHPNLMQILYERVSTIPDFQKTRGVLRLLSLILHSIYECSKVEDIEDSLINVGIIDLSNKEIFNELTNKIRYSEYRAVINSDIISETGGKAYLADQKEKFGNQYRASICIYVYSLIGSTTEAVKGATLTEIAYSVSVPGKIIPSMVKSIVEQVEENFWYVHSEASRISFRVEPNIIKIIEDEANTITPSKVLERGKQLIAAYFGKGSHFNVYVYDSPNQIDENRLSLFIPKWTDISSDGEISEEIESFLRKTKSGGFRDNVNNLFALIPVESRIEKTVKDISRLMASENLIANESFERRTLEQLKKIQKKLQGEISYSLLITYQNVFYVKAGKVEYTDVISGTDSEKSKDFQTLIVESLKKTKKVYDELSPEYLADKVINKADKPLTTKKIRNKFSNDTSLPTVLKTDTLLRCIKEGSKSGHFGLYCSDHYVSSQEITLDNFDRVVNDFVYQREAIKIDPCFVFKKTEAEAIHSTLNRLSQEKKDGIKTKKPTKVTDLDGFIPRKGEKTQILSSFDEVNDFREKKIHSFECFFDNFNIKEYDKLVNDLKFIKLTSYRESSGSMNLSAKKDDASFFSLVLNKGKLSDMFELLNSNRNALVGIEKDCFFDISIKITKFPETNDLIDDTFIDNFKTLKREDKSSFQIRIII